MEIYSVKELSNMTGLNYGTLLVYLGHYSFDKHRKGNKFVTDINFYNTLLKYLLLKNNVKYIEKVERFLNGKLCIARGIKKNEIYLSD